MLLSFDGLNNYFGSMELNDCLMMVSYDDLIIVSHARLKGYFFRAHVCCRELHQMFFYQVQQ
jgi:hypothetical protein